MRWKKTDIETKAKIHEMKINTNAQWSDIAKELDIPERTVNHIIDTEFAEVCRESEKVAQLIDTNDNLQSLADARLKQMLADWEETIRISDLVQVRQSTFTQNQLLKGKATENVNILWDVLSQLQWLKENNL